MAAARLGEGIGAEPLVIERHGLELQRQPLGHRLDRGVAELFRQQQVTRACRRHQRTEKAMLRAIGDDDLLCAGFDAAPLQPGDAGFGMMRRAGLGLVVGQRRQLPAPTHCGQGFGQRRPGETRARQVARQVDRAQCRPPHIGRVPLKPGISRRPHERAPPHFALDQRSCHTLPVGPAGRVGRKVEREGEVAMRRQPGARGQFPGSDGLGQRLDDLQVFGAAAAGELGKPNCHQSNNLADGCNSQCNSGEREQFEQGAH